MARYDRVAGVIWMVVGAALLTAFLVAAWNLVSAVRFLAAGEVGSAGWWLVQTVLAASLGAIGVGFLRLGRRRLRAAGAEPPAPGDAGAEPEEMPRPEPVPVPSPEDVARLEVPIRACPRCGFLGIRAAEVGDGIWPGGGELIYRVCPRCHFRGQPFLFHEQDDYLAFLEDLQREREPAGPV